MKSITIKGSKRESVGKVATKALRNASLWGINKGNSLVVW
jgi:hypothetical protein